MKRQENQAIRKGRFAFQSPTLFFPRIRLYADRLELSGWRLKGRFHRVVPLRQALHIDTPSDRELLIWLSVGETLRLNIEQATRWKSEIESGVLRLQGSRKQP
jgi:hypothetical protein